MLKRKLTCLSVICALMISSVALADERVLDRKTTEQKNTVLKTGKSKMPPASVDKRKVPMPPDKVGTHKAMQLKDSGSQKKMPVDPLE